MIAGILAGLGPLAALLLYFRAPSAMAFVGDNPIVVRVIGVVLFVAGLVGGIFLSITSDSSLATDLMVAGMIGGGILVQLPTMTRRYLKARAESAAARAAPAFAGEFHGWREAGLAMGHVVGHPAAFLQIAGPWALVVSVLQAELDRHAAHGPRPADASAVFWLLALIITAFVATATIAVAWHRLVIRRERPRWWVALPDGASLSYLWRLWLIPAFLGVGARAADYLTQLLPPTLEGVRTDLAGIALTLLFELVIVLLLSQVALRLPALAVGDKDFTMTMSALRSRPWGLAYRAGGLVAMLPFAAAVIGLAWVATRSPLPDAVAFALGLLAWLLLWAAMAAAATFWSRAYLAAKA